MLTEVKADYDTHTLIVFDVEAVFDKLEKIDISGKKLTEKFKRSHSGSYWEWFHNMIMNEENRENESEEEAAAAPPINKSGGRSKKKKSKKKRSKYNDMTVKQLRVLVKKRGKKITKRDGSGYNTKAQLIAKLKRK